MENEARMKWMERRKPVGGARPGGASAEGLRVVWWLVTDFMELLLLTTRHTSLTDPLPSQSSLAAYTSLLQAPQGHQRLTVQFTSCSWCLQSRAQ